MLESSKYRTVPKIGLPIEEIKARFLKRIEASILYAIVIVTNRVTKWTLEVDFNDFEPYSANFDILTQLAKQEFEKFNSNGQVTYKIEGGGKSKILALRIMYDPVKHSYEVEKKEAVVATEPKPEVKPEPKPEVKPVGVAGHMIGIGVGGMPVMMPPYIVPKQSIHQDPMQPAISFGAPGPVGTPGPIGPGSPTWIQDRRQQDNWLAGEMKAIKATEKAKEVKADEAKDVKGKGGVCKPLVHKDDMGAVVGKVEAVRIVNAVLVPGNPNRAVVERKYIIGLETLEYGHLLGVDCGSGTGEFIRRPTKSEIDEVIALGLFVPDKFKAQPYVD